MKRTRIIGLFFLASSFLYVSCDSLLDVDSDRYVFENQYQLNATNDSLYSMFGIFSLMQELADSYVLLGELRGDLMDVTDNSTSYLKEINSFEISDENPYANNKRLYYSIINNCNYIINTVDTSVVQNTNKVNIRLMAAAKAIRAWTYMQLALNFKTAVYYEKPLLTLDEAEASYPEYTLEQMAPYLIADLEPYTDVDELEFGEIYSYSGSSSFFPVNFVLGDLYLWTGDYERAAEAYHDLIYKEMYLISSDFVSSFEVLNNAFTGDMETDWNDIFVSGSSEIITAIAASNENGPKFSLDSFCIDYKIKASSQAYKNWTNQRYYYSSTLDTLSDLRIFGSTLSNVEVSSSGYTYSSPTATSDNYVLKYILYNLSDGEDYKIIVPYRVTLLYLRYAEAVNRLGKPNLAMAVLKYGLNSTTIANRSYIPSNEVPDELPDYMNFPSTYFSKNIGVRVRGCGNVNYDNTYFIIPQSATLPDSIQDMEDILLQELALETAFEGNRFQDLMRIAIRRDDNHVLADKVAAKHGADSATISQKLLIRDNWYLNQ